MDPALLGATRLFFASVLLLPICLRDLKRFPHLEVWRLFKVAFPAGCFLAIHFVTWNAGVRGTLVVHASLIVNMVPVVLPVILWLTHREKINRVEILATLISIAGISWLAVHDYHFSKEYLIGDLVCFGSMVLFAVYLSLGRKNRDSESIFLYVVPVYMIASIICFLVSIPRWTTMPVPDGYDFGIALCLALIPTIIGHTLINYCMRHLRGQVVGIMNVGQFVFAGIFAFFLFGETPQFTFYIVSICVVSACVMVVLTHRENMEEPVKTNKILTREDS